MGDEADPVMDPKVEKPASLRRGLRRRRTTRASGSSPVSLKNPPRSEED